MKYLLYFVVVLFCVYAPQSVKAFSISPLRQTVTADPGTITRVQLEVSNDYAQSIDIEPSIDAFTVNPQTDEMLYGVSSIARDWIQPKQNTIEVPAGQSRIFDFDIRVPADAEPGAHYLMLVATHKVGSQVQGELGSLLFFYVAGQINEMLNVETFAPLKNVYWGGKPEVSLQFRNNGTIHLVPQGTLQIKTRRGEHQTFVMNPENKKLLPHVRWEEDYLIENLSFSDIGKVYAQLTLQYGFGGHTIIRNVSFYYLPWGLVVGILGALIFGVLLLRIVLIKRHAK
ncbi:hypothetical protein H6758_03780 [Candidatus Nomurabacteria bacterium]|nr:hypothetical protein [Candidatus Nomurabacteria bacterium]